MEPKLTVFSRWACGLKISFPSGILIFLRRIALGSIFNDAIRGFVARLRFIILQDSMKDLPLTPRDRLESTNLKFI